MKLGDKVKGFKFEYNTTPYTNFTGGMNYLINKIGIIDEIDKDRQLVLLTFIIPNKGYSYSYWYPYNHHLFKIFKNVKNKLK